MRVHPPMLHQSATIALTDGRLRAIGMIQRPSARLSRMPATVPSSALAHAASLAEFVEAAPSSYHAAVEVRRQVQAAGFTELRESEPWQIKPGGYVVVRDGAVIAFFVPEGTVSTAPCTILGTHTDSPSFKLKPGGTTRAFGTAQVGVEIYGGPLLNSWLDRELEFAGRVVTADGACHLVRSGPLARIPQLAIHLDRTVNDGLTLDKQRHTQPIIAVGDMGEPDGAHVADLFDYLLPDGVSTKAVAGFDVFLADTAAPRVFGAGDTMFASPRLDNLLSTHAAMAALLKVAGTTSNEPGTAAPADPEWSVKPALVEPALIEPVQDANAVVSFAAGAEGTSSTDGRAGLPSIAMLVAFDHEEIGSESRSGAAGPFLAEVLERLYFALGTTSEQRCQALAESLLVSCDVGHGVHPNYADRHDPAVQPVVGGGPILKLNANQRYATDAFGAARWKAACAAAGVPSQDFVSNNAIPCGSTIGPLAATRLGIRTVDVGVPILSMHSARELTGTVDPWYLMRAMTELLRG